MERFRLKEGVTQEDFVKAAELCRRLRGSKIAADVMVMMGIDHTFHGLKTRSKRIRKKRMRQLLRSAALQGVTDLMERVP